MGYKFSKEVFNEVLGEISNKYKIFAPTVLKGKGTFSDTDSIKYTEISDVDEIEFNEKSNFSYKEVLLPITQTLFYFTEDQWTEPKEEEKGSIILLRSCDMHSLKRIDEIYLKNGAEDPYYKKLREKAKFILMGCEKSFENCFCVSMGTNTTDAHDGYIKVEDDFVVFDFKDDELEKYFEGVTREEVEVTPDFVEENQVKVKVPENLDLTVMNSEMWKEYSARCIACGRCNFVCPTCTCFTMQDIFYKDNKNAGERRRVWASCHVNGYTEMAGGHSFRLEKGQRMRFKVLHKVHDYKKRFGYHMCVGCGRCDDICPVYISFSNCVNKLEAGMEEVNK